MIWSWMPPTAVRDHRARLPHRLGDGEPEALGDALLHHDVGDALERIDDHRVLLGVVERQAHEVDVAARVLPEPVAHRLRLLEHLRALGIVGDVLDRRARVDQVGAGLVAGVLGEAADHSLRVLQPVPARHLQHDLVVGCQSRVLEQLGLA